MARTVNIGVQDFSKIIENNDFYVDKTDFIREWWDNRDDVTLITRPRRFGKTLTMSMLNYFFSINHAGRSDLFEDLDIWKYEKYQKLQGTYPVIFLSFAAVKGNNFEKLKWGICREISFVFSQFEFLAESNLLSSRNKAFFNDALDETMNDFDAVTSLNNLSFYLYKYYNKKVLILLDEYDTPMQEAYVNGCWDELTEFMRELFNSTFKTNLYLERGLMTGITRVSKESLFSDLNNLEVVTTASKKYETVFGFTEQEVFQALAEYSLLGEKQQVKEWYDGFRFGNCSSIYNPWSIINFLDKKEFAAYWVNTSSNALAGKLIMESGRAVKIAMEDLLRGKTFEVRLNEEIVFNQLDNNVDAIWSLLLASGYLKTVGFGTNKRGKLTHILKITNEEVMDMFENMFTDWFSTKISKYDTFEDALLTGNLTEMNIQMNKMFVGTFSFFDTGRQPSENREPERFYHGFMLGLIVNLQKIYDITSNRESGNGRYDVMLSPLETGKDVIILEFKTCDTATENNLEDTVKAALQQIIDKKYAAPIEAKGIDRNNIRIYGFGFSGKEVLIDGGLLSEYESSVSPVESASKVIAL